MQDSELEGPFDDVPSEVPQETVPVHEIVEDSAPTTVNGHVEEVAAHVCT
jgi:hypothetical protein